MLYNIKIPRGSNGNDDDISFNPNRNPIFSEKLVLEKGKVATYEFTKPIQVLVNASKVFISLKTIDFKGVQCNSPRKSGIRFKNLDKKKEVKNDLLSCLAPLTVGSCNLNWESLV